MFTEEEEDCENPCCAKDKQERAYVEKIKKVLNEHDPVRKAEEMKRYIRDPQAIIGNAIWREEEGDESSLSGSDDENEVMERLRMERMSQLERDSTQKKQIQTQQTGYSEITMKQLCKELQKEEGALVCHIFIQGQEVCDEVDECLERLSIQFPSTRFTRMPNPSDPATLRSLISNTTAPALACFREGALLGAMNVFQGFCYETDFEESRCLRWLARKDLLEGNPGYQFSDNDEGSDSEDDGCAACDQCGRTYKHEHVRALRVAKHDHDSDHDSDTGL